MDNPIILDFEQNGLKALDYWLSSEGLAQLAELATQSDEGFLFETLEYAARNGNEALFFALFDHVEFLKDHYLVSSACQGKSQKIIGKAVETVKDWVGFNQKHAYTSGIHQLIREREPQLLGFLLKLWPEPDLRDHEYEYSMVYDAVAPGFLEMYETIYPYLSDSDIRQSIQTMCQYGYLNFLECIHSDYQYNFDAETLDAIFNASVRYHRKNILEWAETQFPEHVFSYHNALFEAVRNNRLEMVDWLSSKTDVMDVIKKLKEHCHYKDRDGIIQHLIELKTKDAKMDIEQATPLVRGKKNQNRL